MNRLLTLFATALVATAGCSQYQVAVRDDTKRNIRTVSLEMDHQIDNWDSFRLQMPSGKYLREIAGGKTGQTEFCFILYAVPTVGDFQKRMEARITSKAQGIITDFKIDRLTVKAEYYTPTGDIPIDFSRPSGIGHESKSEMDTITYKVIEVKGRFPKEMDRAVLEGSSLIFRINAGKAPVIIIVTGEKYEMLREFFSVGAPGDTR